MNHDTLRFATTGQWGDLETLRLSTKGYLTPNKPTEEAMVFEDKGKEKLLQLEAMRLGKRCPHPEVAQELTAGLMLT